jgi:DNA-binding beta-propeller fold protein YncE/mono/diheme cytochrome c family protein
MMKRLGLLLVPSIAAAACSAATTPQEDFSTNSSAVTASTKLPSITKVTQPSNPYTLFESLQVRPLALSSDGSMLYALNTPDNRLEIFNVNGKKLTSVGSVEVGLEPIALALHNDNEVWVVNHLSDSVSIVTLNDAKGPRVTRTLFVGDEPRDIVFGGGGKNRAFITTAHRGQNSPDDPDLYTTGAGRADVWVFDAGNLGTALGGTRLTKITLFADTPRALAVTPDGKTVYAAAFFSGDQTTSIADADVAAAYGTVATIPGGGAGPLITLPSGAQVPEPNTGLVVKWKQGPDGTSHWFDAYGTNFDAAVTIRLPDQDVFAIDATANPPVAKANGAFAHVGTTLFNMAVSPKSGKVYVTNTDAHNDVRFEGHTPGFTSVAGNMVDSRISVIDPVAGTVTVANLNPHLNHAAGTGDPTLSRAFPQDLTFSADGKQVFVVAQGSQKLAIYDTAALEAGTATPTQANQVNLTAGGPAGVVVSGQHAFVLTRFDDGISVVDVKSATELSHTTMFSPEPASVTTGRKFLYSAKDTSALGDQACASCHIGGDFDGLAWDLGNPGATPLPIVPLEQEEAAAILTASAQANGGAPTAQAVAQADAIYSGVFTISPIDVAATVGQQVAEFVLGLYMTTKGPMTTQSLRGLDNAGPMHWRGDRNGAVQQTGLPFVDGSGNPVASAQPNSGIYDEVNGFKSFNVAFPGLVDDANELSDADMTSYATFALQISYPPNPIRALDNSLNADQTQGQSIYFQSQGDGTELPIDRFHNCNGCHTLDRTGNAGLSPHPGFFGTSGRLSFEDESQSFKVPHLRNAYQKLGMYGSSVSPGHNLLTIPGTPYAPSPTAPVQAVRGFGFNHDGIEASPDSFFAAFVFAQTFVPVTFGGTTFQPNPGGIPVFNDPTSTHTDPLDPTQGLDPNGVQARHALSAYVLAFDTNFLPVVGQQTTLTSTNSAVVLPRLALFEAQAAAANTDLVARAAIAGVDSGFVYVNGAWQGNVSSVPAVTDAQLEALIAKTGSITFTSVPPGEGFRDGIDRDSDGYADGDELLAKTNPADPNSYPGHP